MVVKKIFFSFFLVMILSVGFSYAESKDEKTLDLLLDNGLYKNIFTDVKNECGIIAQNILDNKTEFLQDLKIVLENDKENLLVLVDKTHFLRNDYVPEDLVPMVNNSDYSVNKSGMELRDCVEKALRIMAIDAKKNGNPLLVSSCYRSYDYQKRVYERNVRQMGKAAADRESAMPGTSQHQLGVAIDFGSISDDFAETAAGKWLSKHAADYGFSLSFPNGYENVTGYRWECWHYRYVGKEAIKFQEKWFGNIQQYMMEFIYHWRRWDFISKNDSLS